uniref:AMIN domain-containing protein n=1 Tax=Nitratidesulfovibrio vulgaris (strain DSM 19637 / Miyazaki F) TaxID=883 RepID=B8DNG2_NITV9
MNKTIAMLIPTVVLFAMALILFNHFGSGDEKPAPVEGPSVQAPMQAPTQGQPQPGQPGMPYFEQGGQGALAPGQSGGQPGGTMTETPAGMVSPGEGEPAATPPGASASAEPRTALGRMASKSGADLATPLESKKKEPVKGTDKGTEKAAPAKQAEKAAPTPAKAEKTEKAAPAAKPQAAAPAPAAQPAPAKAAAAPASPQTAKGDHAITSATIKFSGSTAILHLQGDAPIQYKYIVLPNPDRLALDLVGAWSVSAPAVPSNRVIEKVRVGRYGENTRIVLDLKAAPTKHEVVKSGDKGIEVRVQ